MFMVNHLIGFGVGSVERAQFTTWNPSDKAANITLSNGNLTATGGASTPSVRSTTSFSSGKRYCEIQFLTVTGASGLGGFGDSTMSLNNYVGASGTSAGHAANNTTLSNNMTTAVAPGVSFTNNDIMSLAIDLNAGSIWVGKNNTWTSGSPSAGTSPNFTYTAPVTLFIASSWLSSSDSGLLIPYTTTYGAPAGFLEWDA